MQNTNTSKAWSLCAISTVGMLVFAGLYFSAPKTSSGGVQTVTQLVTNTVTKTVTNEVVKEVPKAVEKIVQVPADIPPEYVLARDVYRNMTNASFASLAQVLFKMDDVRVKCSLDDDVRKLLSEDEVKAKFELTLRRNNVPIQQDSKNTVSITLHGFLIDSIQGGFCFAITCHVFERQLVFRQGECHAAIVSVWDTGEPFGIVGKSQANETLLKAVEKRAEIFANAFLSANPKPK